MSVRPILCIDFDGVIHRYSRGWQGGEIYDPVTEGFFEWALAAQELFTMVIYSSRSKTSEGRLDMQIWLDQQFQAWRRADYAARAKVNKPLFTFSNEKPNAFLTIDDRCVRFDGEWDALNPAKLRRYEPWTTSIPATTPASEPASSENS
jgi:hypothetical protein